MNDTTDIHALTGAYVIDALPDHERAQFELHLPECAECQSEVRALQATTAHLAAAEYAPPPPSLKGSVMAEIRRTPQQQPPAEATDSGSDALGRSRLRTTYQRLLAPTAAVLVLLVIGLTAAVANLSNRLDQLETVAAPVAEILTAPDAITVSADGPGNSNMRLVASPTRGEGVFLAGGLDQAPADRDYQLWLLQDGEATPAGLLDIDERGRGAHVMTGDMAEVDAVALTVEPSGGSAQPTSDPISVLELPEA